MINRQNFLDVRAYLAYSAQTRQNAPATVDRYRKCLRHLLEWADETPFPKSRILDPFPIYLKATTLAPASILKTLMVARQFFTFCRMEYPHLYKPITETWIESLQPPRDLRPQSRIPERSYYTLEEVLKLCAAPVTTLRLQRAQAGLAMLYLSGMRADALASIPIHCVDLPNRAIQQLPEFGVRTKGRKAAITYLLPIPELLAVVERWQSLHSAFCLSNSALWYSTLYPFNERLIPTEIAFEGRYHLVERDIEKLCETLGMKYLSPHKLRHGHVVYSVGRVKTMRELKAVSLNVMHSSVITTDSIYNRLMGNEVRDVIQTLT